MASTKKRWSVNFFAVTVIATAIGLVVDFSELKSMVMPTPNAEVDIKYYTHNKGRYHLINSSSIEINLTYKDYVEQSISVPINLAVSNETDSPLEVVQIELHYPEVISVDAGGTHKISPDNDSVIIEHGIEVLQTTENYTPLKNSDVIEIPFLFQAENVLTITSDDVPLNVIGILGSIFGSRIDIPIRAVVVAKGHKPWERNLVLSLSTRLQIFSSLGGDADTFSSVNIRPDDEINTLLEDGGKIIHSWVRKTVDTNRKVEYRKVSYENGIYQIVYLDDVIKSVYQDIDGNGYIESFYLNDNQGSSLNKKMVISPYKMLDWGENIML